MKLATMMCPDNYYIQQKCKLKTYMNRKPPNTDIMFESVIIIMQHDSAELASVFILM
jgi:hypothetical protein